MIKTVSQTTIADVFSITSDKTYKIPKYQREYTWGIKEWDALFNDVTENDFGYFLGSYICVNSSTINGTVLEVIDGQQRFSTITLLLAALYSELAKHKTEMDEDDLSELSNLRNELANKKQKFTASGGKVTEYNQRLLLQKQNSNDEDYSATIGNIMRRVLEAFSTFNYQKNIEKVSCDKNVLKALGKHSTYFENLMYRLVLHGESHYEEQVYSIHDGNNFYEFISETEKQKTAKNVLCFIYLLNPYHMIAYLQEEPNSINKIKLWVKDIPENDSFEISKTVFKRIVPLYDLPLSAGVGNENFDGIPFEEYETENLLCDFALKISGDSMEPNIKDKSVVLIKRQSVVDEGKVGAFFLNDKVYCKYLSYVNGKTLLCSYNDKYAPIEVKEYDTLFAYGEVIAII